MAQWLSFQRDCFPSIDGVFLLDDIVGFLGEEDFIEFADPFSRPIYSGQNATVKFFHNDTPCAVSAPYYSGWGVNLYNPGTDCSLGEIMTMTGDAVTILGGIPPRDVLALATPYESA